MSSLMTLYRYALDTTIKYGYKEDHSYAFDL